MGSIDRRVVALLMGAAVLSLSAVAGGVAASESVENVTMEVSDHLHVGQQANATVIATDGSGESLEVTDETTFSVANETVLTLKNATITADTPGTTTINATYDNHTDEVTVSVVPPVADLLDVWDRSVLPFRTDTEDATYTVDNQLLTFSAPNEPEVQANRLFLSMFEPGLVTLDYTFTSGANVMHEWPEEHVIVVGGNVNATDNPMTDPAAFGSLDGETLERLNEDIDFETVTEDQLDGNGELYGIEYVVERGQKVVFMFTVGDPTDPAVTEEDGDLLIHNETDLIGVEGFVVQDHGSTVETEWLAPGAPLTANVTSDLGGADHNHMVVVYDEDTYGDAGKLLNVTGDTDAGLASDDIRIENDIGEIVGYTDVDENLTLLDIEPEHHNVAWPITVTSVPGLVAADVEYHQFPYETGEEVLAASLTAVHGNQSASTTVRTPVEWGADEYRWIHLVGNDTNVLASATGTVEPTFDEPESIAIDLGNETATAGQTTTVTVTATFPDGTTADVTPETDLTTNDTAVAVVEEDVVSTNETGSVTVKATFGNLSATSSLVVEPVPPVYDLELPNDGGVYAVGYPGPASGTLADAFPDGTAGIEAVYRYDDGWNHVTDFAGEQPDALDVYAVSTSGSGPDTVPVTVALELEATAEPVGVDSGWAVIAPPAHLDADDILLDTDALLVLDRFTPPVGANTSPTSFSSHVVGSSQWGGDSPVLDPFGGYFVYFEEATSLEIYANELEDRDHADEMLHLDE